MFKDFCKTLPEGKLPELEFYDEVGTDIWAWLAPNGRFNMQKILSSREQHESEICLEKARIFQIWVQSETWQQFFRPSAPTSVVYSWIKMKEFETRVR